MTFALFEVACAVFGIDLEIGVNWHFHPALGWTQNPSGDYTYEDWGDEVRIQFNRDGFRDRERTLEKEPGVKRIVLIGDSFSEATQVNFEDTFYYQLEARLNERPGEKWEVLNFGVGDFGTTQAYIALREFGLRYEPDIVISQSFPMNDVLNNTIDFFGFVSKNDRYRPYFVEQGDSLELVEVQPVRMALRRKLNTYGVLERAFIKAFAPDKLPRDEELLRRCEEIGLPPIPPYRFVFASEEDQPAPIRKGWRITERVLAMMIEEVRGAGAKFLGLVVPYDDQLGEHWEKFTSYFKGIEPALSADYPEARLRAFFEEQGVASLMLKPVFEQHIDEVLPSRGFHFNPAAHRLTAEALYQALVEGHFLEDA